MRKRQWLLSVLLCFVIIMLQLVAPAEVNKRIQTIIYSPDDFLYMRKLVKNFFEDETVIPVNSSPTLQVNSIEPFENGYLIELNEMQVISNGSGIILFTGNSKKLGKMMTVFYDYEELTVTYGMLHEIKQLPYIQIEHGNLLATLNRKKTLYIEIEKDGNFLTLEEVKSWLYFYD